MWRQKQGQKKAPLPSLHVTVPKAKLDWFDTLFTPEMHNIIASLKKSCSWNTYKRGMIALAKDRKPPDRHHLGYEKIRPLSRSCIFVVPNKREGSNKRKACKKQEECNLTKEKRKTLWEYLFKFIYSEKATRFCEIFTLLLSYGVPVKSKLIISQNFVAFSEYMNFTWKTSGRVDYFSETNKRGCSFIRNLR